MTATPTAATRHDEGALGPGTWAHDGTEIAPGVRLGGMVPPDDLLAAGALPTARLTETGRPNRAARSDYRRIHNLHNALNVAAVWAQSLGVIAVALWIGHPLAYVVAFVLMGRGFALFGILTHEASHRLLFSNRRTNDLVGRWLLSYPGFIPFDIYRRSHMAHHKEVFGPGEPDIPFYMNYPVPPDSARRKLFRDAFFVSGYKNLRSLVRAVGSDMGRRPALQIFSVQAALFVVLTLMGGWWVYPVLWLAPWMSVWRVINRLRAVAEHGGMGPSEDVRKTTHHVRQSWFARFWFVPYNTGWHLAHHVDAGIPFQELPRLHEELVDAGFVTPAIVYPRYTALWRAQVQH